MCDGFAFERGKSLFDDEEVCGRLFSVGRSETAQHNIYERVGRNFAVSDENIQKSKKNEENQR